MKNAREGLSAAADRPVHNSEVVEPTAAQNKRLLAYLRANGHVSPMQAWHLLGIYRLGARVFELRQAGHNITTARVEVSNRFGERCHVAVYKLEEK